jgi:hypothetical protein
MGYHAKVGGYPFNLKLTTTAKQQMMTDRQLTAYFSDLFQLCRYRASVKVVKADPSNVVETRTLTVTEHDGRATLTY